jgi:hypothetical protein
MATVIQENSTLEILQATLEALTAKKILLTL